MPSGAIFALDEIGREITECLGERELSSEELTELLLARGYEIRQIEAALTELEQSEVVLRGDAVRGVAQHARAEHFRCSASS